MKKGNKAIVESKIPRLEEHFVGVTPLDDIVSIPVENLEDLQCLKKALETELMANSAVKAIIRKCGSTQQIEQNTQRIYSCHRLLRILNSVLYKHGIDLEEK